MQVRRCSRTQWTLAQKAGGGNSMPIYVFRIQVAPDAEPELKEIAAVDFVTAVQTLAAWCPGVHIIKLEGICTVPAAVA